MFNDKYGLTKAVLEGRKTQTRRLLHYPKTFGGKYVSGFRLCTNKQGVQFAYLVDEDECEIDGSVNVLSAYKIGEEVAVAQAYENFECYALANFFINNNLSEDEYVKIVKSAGWHNKMFVKADLMPHRIKITNIRVERLHDITDDDCLKEGLEFAKGGFYTGYNKETNSRIWLGNTPREAFATLIDKVSGKGTWEPNPYAFVYDFKLVK